MDFEDLLESPYVYVQRAATNCTFSTLLDSIIQTYRRFDCKSRSLDDRDYHFTAVKTP